MSQIRVGWVSVYTGDPKCYVDYVGTLTNYTPGPGSSPFEPEEILSFSGGTGEQAECTYFDEANNLLYYSGKGIVGAPDNGDTVTGLTSGASATINGIVRTFNPVTEGIGSPQLFAITQSTNEDRLVDYTIASANTGYFTLAANYAGDDALHQTYLAHTSFTANASIPMLEAGDAGVRAIQRAAAKRVDDILKDVLSLGLNGSFSGKQFHSARVNTGETALETRILSPIDGSIDYTGYPKFPATDPTHTQHPVTVGYMNSQGFGLSGYLGKGGNQRMEPGSTLWLGPTPSESGTSTSSTTTRLYDTSQSWSPTGKWIGYMVFTGAPDYNWYIIDESGSNYIGINGTWAIGDVIDYWIVPLGENTEAATQGFALARETAIRADMADDISDVLPYGEEWQKGADQTGIATSSYVAIGDLNNKEIPGANGVRNYDLSFQVQVRGTQNQAGKVEITCHYGTLGTTSDTIRNRWVFDYPNSVLRQYNTLSVGNAKIPYSPAAGLKVTLGIYTPYTLDIIGGNGSIRSGAYTGMTISQIMRQQ